MQTVTFQCGRCGRLIAVGEENLSRRVRCPYCQGVVLTQVPLAAPSIDVKTALESTSLLSPLQLVETSSPATEPETKLSPNNEYPAEPVPESVSWSFADAERERPAVELTAAVLHPGTPLQSAEAFTAPEMEAPSVRPPEELPLGSTGEVSSLAGRRLGRPRAGVSIWFVIPLVSYSILATTLIGILWFRLQTVEVHPLIAFLPDAEGDAPGVIRKPKAVNDARKRRLIGEPVPDELKLRPGETRIVGALAVTAEGITREQVGIGDGSNEPTKLDVLSLVLHLRVENVSKDESFQPLDRYFDRKWREGSSTAPPLTLLEAGRGVRFFGGPATWQPRRSSARNNGAAPEFIYLMRGDKPVVDPIDRPLEPGETSEVFVCTDGNDPRSAALLHHRGAFLWRVQLRRGLVHVSGRDVPAAAVIGVAFTDRDISGG